MKKVIFICVVSLAVCFVAGNTEEPSTPTPTPKKTEIPTTKVPPGHSDTAATAPTQPTSTSTTLTPKPNGAGGKTTSSTTTSATTTSTITTTPAPNTTASVPPSTTNATTTSSSITPPTTPKAEISSMAPEPKQARGFDGPSFIGGIILALGLLAIGYMGFRYYRNQTERNYHTL